MSDIKTPMTNRGGIKHVRRASSYLKRIASHNLTHQTQTDEVRSWFSGDRATPKNPTDYLKLPKITKQGILIYIGKSLEWVKRHTAKLPLVRRYPVYARVGWGFMALIVLSTVIIEAYQAQLSVDKYRLSAQASAILPTENPSFAAKLRYDSSEAAYLYNSNYTPNDTQTGQVSGPKFKASFASDAKKGISVSDPVNNVDLGLAPKFAVDAPIQQNSRLVYPLTNKKGAVVYTLRAGDVKEDIVLERYIGDQMAFDYQLSLAEGTEARMESNGSVGVYGSSGPLLGNVSTGTDKDVELLKKARQAAVKDKLLFAIPAPFVIDATKSASQAARSWYSLKGDVLTVHATNLRNAKYPLSIDPSVYIETAAKFMRGNNESNIDFDTTNELIKKGETTGARINKWNATTPGLANATWDGNSVVAGGFVYSLGGQEVYKSVFATAGTNTFVVPSGVSTITVKAWGAGGGGAAGSGSTGVGGAGGGGGFAQGNITVSAGEPLTVEVGTGGFAGPGPSNGGDGGGYSAIKRTSTYLVQAGGGAGGGGSFGTTNGGAGGAGGGAVAAVGAAASTASAAGGGNTTTSTLGAAGGAATGGVAGAAGATNAGGDAGGSFTTCNTPVTGRTGGSGGTGAGGAGGDQASCAGGGGGGSGRYGGGGGGSGSNAANRGGGGGGGGSDYVGGAIGGTTTETSGSGTTPGNNADADRNGAAGGGTGAVNSTSNTAGGDGIVIISYTIGGNSVANNGKLQWAQINSNGTLSAPTTGSGTCSAWCTNSLYDLYDTGASSFVTRRGFSMVAYNGFLYVMGGLDSASARTSTVYIAKLGANGEPQLWHPTGGTKAYWYKDSGLNGATARSYFSAVAYNNRIYVLGGQTNAATTGITTVEMANINPTGTLSTWTNTGMQTIPNSGTPAGLYMNSALVFNDAIYLLGGFNGANTSSANLKNTVYYSKLNTDGTMNTWVLTNTFATARATYGGTFATIWGSYIYMGGGCTAVNASGYCTTVASDVQLASINADDSLAEWGTMLNITNKRIGGTLVAWANNLYRIGGCMVHNTSTGGCDSTIATTDYGTINQDGDASTVNNSSPANTSSCSGTSPVNCDLPATGDGAGQGGQMSSAVVINNGYIYVIGGCTSVASTNVCETGGTAASSGNTSIAAIDSQGRLSKPAYCSGTYVTNSLWCVDSTNQINTTLGVSAASAAVFNNTIYVVGGTNGATWSSSVWHTSLNQNGSLGGWGTAQSFTNLALGTSRGYSFSFTRANPSSPATYPGNLYVLGGCYIAGGGTGDDGIGCSTYFTDVYKCNILASGALEEADANDCTTTGQMQIDSDNINGSAQGLGLMAGTIYANRIYLVGGSCPSTGANADAPCGANYAANRRDTIYAKIDNSNNIVDNTTGLSSGSWAFTTGQMNPVRRRAVSFGYNGYVYSLAGYSGTASLEDLLFAKIDVSTGDMGSFGRSEVVVTPRWDLRAIVSNGYVYAIGGCATGTAPDGCTAMQPQVQTFQLYNNDSGAVSSYTTSAGNFATSTDRKGASSVIYNGYIYVAGGCVSTTCTTTADFTTNVQYALINKADGSIGTWNNASNGLIRSRAWGYLTQVGGTLYYVGGEGDDGSGGVSTSLNSYYVIPSGSGDITVAWTDNNLQSGSANLPSSRSMFGAATWNNRIYVLGGKTSDGTPRRHSAISNDLSGGGIITAWTNYNNNLPIAKMNTAAVAYSGNLYLFGGIDTSGNYYSDTLFAPLGYKVGTITQLGTTVTGGGSPTPAFTASMVGSKIQYTNDGSTATITAVPTATTLTVDVDKTVATASPYIIQDGTIGTWSYTTSLPGKLANAQAFASNGYIYLVGGQSTATNCSASTIVAPVSSNTKIKNSAANPNDPTGIGDWYTTNARMSGARHSAAVAYADGKMYVMGGACTSNLGPNYTTGTIGQSGNIVTGAGGASWTDNYLGATITYQDASTATVVSVTDATHLVVSVSKTVTAGQTYTLSTIRNYYSTIKSQAQVARYSRLIDTDTDVFPTKWLMNGIDNSTGAEWYLRYRSMHDTSDDPTNEQNPHEDCGTSITMPLMTGWGQETNFGKVSLGDPQTYTAKESAGADIHCARYFYFSINVDASQAFGYPEDIQRGPTIDDLSLFFNADPSKRLRHGKTFTGGQKQPLSTPF